MTDRPKLITQSITRVDSDAIAVLTIDRPPANALAPEMLDDSRRILASLHDDPPAAAVLTGTGRFFSAGLDLREVPDLSPDDQLRMAEGINEAFDAWYALGLPLVSAVNGHAVAGGLILAMCGDHRVGVADARYGLTEVKVGIPYPSSAMAIVRAELTAQSARRLTLRGELFDGHVALGLGILDELSDDPLARALEVATELAELPSATFATVKASLRGGEAPEGRWLNDETRAAAERMLGG